jgi:hypothetical protein
VGQCSHQRWGTLNNGLPPELSDEWENEPERPSSIAKKAKLMKIIGIVALVSMVLPGVLVTWTTSRATANAACGVAVAYYAPSASRWQASFDVLPLGHIGWNCYVYTDDGFVLRVAHLGIVPGVPTLQPSTGI